MEEGFRGPEPGTGASAPAALGSDVDGKLPAPGKQDLSLDADEIRVAIPADISSVMAASMEAAVEWREATRAVLTHYMSRGYEVRELLRARYTSDYLLVRDPEG